MVAVPAWAGWIREVVVDPVKSSRRGFLKYASLSGLGAFIAACLSQNAPATGTNPSAGPGIGGGIAGGQTVNWKFQTSFGQRDIIHEMGVGWANKVTEMSGGRFKIDVLPAGAVVGAFDVIDAVSGGSLDAGMGVPAYWWGKKRALTLFGTGPNFGMDADGWLGWFYYGGGQELWTEFIQKKLNLNVVSFLFGPFPNQPLGWFKNEIKSPADFQGLKFRTVGIAIDTYAAMGATVIALPGGEVVPGLEKNTIDAAEFNNTTSDRALGFQDVRKVLMTGSYHQPAETLEVQVNKGRWDALGKDLQAIVKYAAWAQSADMQWTFMDRNSKDFIELQKAGVRFIRTPQSVLDAQLTAWDAIIKKETAADPDFGRVLDSQRAWAERVSNWRAAVDMPRPDNQSANHYFKK
jgi:TRAP-type mannitol/chloroaromatic compound transport system substrate-binding protein